MYETIALFNSETTEKVYITQTEIKNYRTFHDHRPYHREVNVLDSFFELLFCFQCQR